MIKYRLTAEALAYLEVNPENVSDIRANPDPDSVYPFLGTVNGEKDFLLARSEVEVVEDEIEVGSRVRCTNDTDCNGLHGTVERVSHGYGTAQYLIRWDGLEGDPNGFSTHGGYWSDDSVELLTEGEDEEGPSALEVKNAALTVAAFVFEHYRDLHFAKETPESTMKGLTNAGLAQMMLDALEAD